MEPCTVGIVIPTLNAQDEIGELLELLKNQTRALDEILVIDSSSDDDTVSIVESFEGVRLISIERKDFNHGLTRDLGMRTLQSDFILFLTHDRCRRIVVQPHQLLKAAGIFLWKLPAR